MLAQQLQLLMKWMTLYSLFRSVRHLTPFLLELLDIFISQYQSHLLKENRSAKSGQSSADFTTAVSSRHVHRSRLMRCYIIFCYSYVIKDYHSSPITASLDRAVHTDQPSFRVTYDDRFIAIRLCGIR
jgi:hypothetical protein